MIDTVVAPGTGALTASALDPLIDLESEINRLRREKNAVILAHYYQAPEIQDIADFVGDSLDLSRKAANTDADMIAFCGVKFMAEGAKILSPDKTVVLPDREAGCSLEDSCPPDAFREFREAHPDHIALTYINCSAEVKALSDIIVTSSNAEYIIRQIPESQKILFAPDKHLGGFLAKKTGREMTLWPGTCIVHEQFNACELAKLKVRHPEAEVLAHPECQAAVLDQADFIASTTGIIKRSVESPAETLIIATEDGVFHQIEKKLAEQGRKKTLIQAPGMDESCACNRCPFMRLNTLEKLYLCMRDLSPEVTVPEEIRRRALVPIERMLALSKAQPPREPRADARA